VPRAARTMHILIFTNFSNGAAVMCIEKYVRNFGFALAAIGIVFGVGYTFEYLPVVNALVR
jgi:hypothetical protein